MKRIIYAKDEQDLFLHNILHCNVKCVYIGQRQHHNDKTWKCKKYDIEIENFYNGEVYSFSYYRGLGLKNRPCIYEILGNFKTNWLEYDFENFCCEMGYDPDSRKAFKIWEECQNESKNIMRVIPNFYNMELPELEDY